MTDRDTFVCDLDHPVEAVFDAWLDPDIRRAVTLRQVYKNGIKALDPTLGGQERYEYRWRNRLSSTETRTYKKIERPHVIEAEVYRVHAKTFGPRWIPTPPPVTLRETLSFEPTPAGCRVVARTLHRRRLTQAWVVAGPQTSTAGWWRLDFDVFLQGFDQRPNGLGDAVTSP
ncbi:MAG: SRPBCC domain-containing protein [Pseudomonadota bacterium]